MNETWIPVIVDYIYTKKGKKENLFAHAKRIENPDNFNRTYYQVIIPELDYMISSIVIEKIKKFL